MQAVAPAELVHRRAERLVDERVDDHGRAVLRAGDGELDVVGRLDARVPDDLELGVGELRLEREHEPNGGLAGRVRDDVQLDEGGAHGGNVRMTALTCRLVERSGPEEARTEFAGPRAPRSALRRAVWRWHAEREAALRAAQPDPPRVAAAERSAASPRRWPPGSAVLDVGGGNRPLARPARQRRRLHRRRPRPAASGVARRKASTYVVADATALPFADATFGLVLMIEMLQYVGGARDGDRRGRARPRARRRARADDTPGLARARAARGPLPLHPLRARAHARGRRAATSAQLTPLGGPATLVTATLENNIPAADEAAREAARLEPAVAARGRRRPHRLPRERPRTGARTSPAGSSSPLVPDRRL